eukprot:2990857-Rhodomonas_salina.1
MPTLFRGVCDANPCFRGVRASASTRPVLTLVARGSPRREAPQADSTHGRGRGALEDETRCCS